MELSPQAKTLWENIPANVRIKLLNNAHCSACQKVVGIGAVKGRVVDGDIVLEGVCTTCGGQVCRLIETSGR